MNGKKKEKKVKIFNEGCYLDINVPENDPVPFNKEKYQKVIQLAINATKDAIEDVTNSKKIDTLDEE